MGVGIVQSVYNKKITSYHDSFLGVEIRKRVAILLHMFLMLGHC